MGRTPFPLIEQEVGAITYENTDVRKLYGDVYIGDAERNYYIDRYHEINLYAHYNVRRLGTYTFIPEYRFYLLDGRMPSIFQKDLGVPLENMVIEKYSSIEEASVSKYHKDFIELKKNIDERIECEKKRETWEYGYNDGIYMTWSNRAYPSGKSYYLIETATGNGPECIQVHLDERIGKWKASRSLESILDLWRCFRDFDEINEKELHLMEYLPMKNNNLDENSPYYNLWMNTKREYQRRYKKG